MSDSSATAEQPQRQVRWRWVAWRAGPIADPARGGGGVVGAGALDSVLPAAAGPASDRMVPPRLARRLRRDAVDGFAGGARPGGVCAPGASSAGAAADRGAALAALRVEPDQPGGRRAGGRRLAGLAASPAGPADASGRAAAGRDVDRGHRRIERPGVSLSTVALGRPDRRLATGEGAARAAVPRGRPRRGGRRTWRRCTRTWRS